MNKPITILMLALAAVSCNQNTGRQAEVNNEDNAQKNIIRKELPVYGSFYQITSIGTINIILSQGDFKIALEGDSTLLSHVETEFDSGTLTIGMRSEKNTDIKMGRFKSGITAYISCPKIQIISVCGDGDITTKGTIKSEDLQIGTLGKGTLSIDSIQCTSFKYESTTDGTATFKHIACGNGIINVMGNGKLTAAMNCDKTATMSFTSNSKNDITLSAKDVDLISDGYSKNEISLNTERLVAAAFGHSATKLKGMAAKKKITQGKLADIEDNLIE